MKPKVSVIMPSLNVADYIGESIESVTAQTMEDIEILCVDAGSSDGTLEIIKDHASHDVRIKVIEADKKSYGYQMNLGIRTAVGEYVGIVETDDWIDADMFEILYRKAKETDADAVKCAFYDVYEKSDGSYCEVFTDFIDDTRRLGEVFSPDDDPSVHKWDRYIWNGIYKREFLTGHDMVFNESPGAAFQDIGVQQIILNEASSILFLHNHFYHYRKVRQGSSTWNPKCVRYLYDEYRRLFASDRIKKNHRKWVLAKLVAAFFYEFEKALCYGDFNKNNLECPEAAEWFAGIMQEALDKGDLVENLLNETDQKRLRLFLEDEDMFIADYKARMQELYKWARMVTERTGKDRIIVFGCGNYGKAVAWFLIRNSFNIVGMVDNNRGIRNQTYYGLKVMSVDDAIRFYPDAFFIVANKRSGAEIFQQLGTAGIREDKVLIFDGSNDVLCGEIMNGPILTGLIKSR